MKEREEERHTDGGRQREYHNGISKNALIWTLHRTKIEDL